MRTTNQIVEIALKDIVPSPYQPRETITSGLVSSLAESIRAVGLQTPIHVRKVGGRFELIAGHCRVAAFRSLGRSQIPAIIVEATDAEAAVAVLVDNVDRVDLNPMEVARSVERLVTTVFGGDEKAAAERLGKSVVFVRDRRALVTLPVKIQALLIDGKLTLANGVSLAKVEDAALQHKAAELAANRRWTQAELLAYLQNQKPKNADPVPDRPRASADALNAAMQTLYDEIDAGSRRFTTEQKRSFAKHQLPSLLISLQTIIKEWEKASE